MTLVGIVELSCLILSAAMAGLLAEAYLKYADEKVERIKAQERLVTMTQRSRAAEAIIRAAGVSPEFERHVDLALEQAEPTPDIRRVR